MPVYSMTGYASAQHSTASTPGTAEIAPEPASQLGLEIRSVNSRFLDLTFRLPEELRAFEPSLRELIVGKLKRGKIEVRATIDVSSSGKLADPSPKLLQRLNAVQDSVKAWLPQAQTLSVAEVIQLASGEQTSNHDWGRMVMPLAEKSLKELMTARQREGARLVEMLLERIGQLRTLCAQAGPLVPKLVEQQRLRFMERWREAMALTEGSIPPRGSPG